MATFTYHGTAYKQTTDSSVLFTFAAVSEELLQWAHIPRRTESATGGFQRPTIPANLDKLSKFFEDSNNSSPTSLTAGFLPEKAELKFHEEDVKANLPIKRAMLTIEFDGEEDLDSVVQRVKEQIESRLPSNEDIGESDTSENDIEEDAVEEIEEDEAEGEEDEIDAWEFTGESQLRELLENIQDEEWLSDSENIEFLRDYSKPGVLIDGQHRALAAGSLMSGIPYACVAIMDAEWSELVFQFALINKLQQKVKPEFITANAALSLTSDEMSALSSRLDLAGSTIVDVQLFNSNENSPNSPFRGMIATGLSKGGDSLGYQQMQKLALTWYKAKSTRWGRYLKEKYGSRTATEAREKWQEGDWATEYHKFWNVVKEEIGSNEHNGSTLWEIGNGNLLKTGAMLALQEAFFRVIDYQFDYNKHTTPRAPFGPSIDEYLDTQTKIFITNRKVQLASFVSHEPWPTPIVGGTQKKVSSVFEGIMMGRKTSYQRMSEFSH